jgi:hypothetical protein
MVDVINISSTNRRENNKKNGKPWEINWSSPASKVFQNLKMWSEIVKVT